MVLVSGLGLTMANAADRFPWMDEPYTGNPGQLLKIDPRLVNLDGTYAGQFVGKNSQFSGPGRRDLKVRTCRMHVPTTKGKSVSCI